MAQSPAPSSIGLSIVAHSPFTLDYTQHPAEKRNVCAEATGAAGGPTMSVLDCGSLVVVETGVNLSLRRGLLQHTSYRQLCALGPPCPIPLHPSRAGNPPTDPRDWNKYGRKKFCDRKVSKFFWVKFMCSF